MKTYKLFICFIFLTQLGCTPDKELHTGKEIYIYGNTKQNFQPDSSRTRSADELPENSRISLFSKGGLDAHNLILTYNGDRWTGDIPQWDSEQKSTDVIAYYPPIETNQQDLYDEDGRLTDMLYHQKQYAYGESIYLTFSHLFSKAIFVVNPALNEQIKEITFKPSVGIDKIIAETACINYKEEAPESCFNQEPSGRYSLIIPPSEQMSIDIEITTKEENIFRAQMPSSQFKAGVSYICRIEYQNESVGICSAEDFIAFTHLINGKAYKERTLDEFGTNENGQMIYYLKNDIRFTPEQCKELMQIGWKKTSYNNQPFNDVFDGQGHVLSDLVISPQKGYAASGLFGSIGENGAVKNLILHNTTISEEHYSIISSGALVGENKGTVDNCHIRKMTFRQINGSSDFYGGGLVGRNLNCMVNCSVDSLISKAKSDKIGGLVGTHLKGNIINCYTTNCKMRIKAQKTLCHRCDANIYNCYVYVSSGQFDAVIHTAIDCTVSGCYYPKNIFKKAIFSTSGNVERINTLPYNIQTMELPEGQHVISYMNKWVENEGKTLFPELNIRKWELNENRPSLPVRSYPYVSESNK